MPTCIRCLLAATLLLTPVLPAAAQANDGEIRIRVLDHDGDPVAGVEVQLLGPTRQAQWTVHTDAAGNARLAPVPYGRYELRVSDPIFTDVSRAVELDTSELTIEIALRPTGIEEKVTVTASRGAVQQESKVPATVRSLDLAELRLRAVDLLPRMLDEEPGILTQQTTPGQGSPILRGQSAQAVLYLLDGVRFNNATYRAGNTQYLGWIPDVAVSSVETQLGPAGVSYGSDALGGAVNVISNSVPSFQPARPRWSGSYRVFGESASAGGGFNGTVGVSTPRFAGYVAISGAHHNDVRSGGGRDSHNATVRFLGFTDAQVREQFGSRLDDTSYSQGGVSSKATLQAGAAGTLTAYFSGSRQYDVRRYDRLLGGEGRVLASFGPQRLGFGYLRYERFLAETLLESTVSVNRQTDGRRDQRRPTSAIRDEKNSVTALGLETSVSTDLSSHLVSAGFEIYDERVDAERFETSNGVTEQIRGRFPDQARYTSLGVFLLDDFQAASNRLNVALGARFSAFRYAVRAADNILNGAALVPDSTQNFNDLTLNAGATYAVTDELGVWARVARGFRAPSVFDLGGIGLSGGGFEVAPDDAVRLGSQIGDSAGRDATSTGNPWNALEPETLWSYEVGLRWFSDDTRIEITAFDSEFRQAIARRVLIVNQPVVGQVIGGREIIGQDAAGRVFVDNELDPVVSRANISALRVRGLEILAQRSFGAAWLATVKASLQRGWELDTGFFARKIAPDNLTAIVRWRSPSGGLWLEGVIKGAATQDRLNPGDLEDTRIGAFRDAGDIADFFNNQGPRLGLVQGGVLTATGETLDEVISRVLGADGRGAPLFTETSGWLTLGVRGAWTVAPHQTLSFALTNITDTNYRLHGSGFDGLGIGVDVSYSVEF